MLNSIRKFSSTIYAKILLGIIVIPFVFWGMGSTFTGGNKNVVLIIDKDKYSTQEFANFIQRFNDPNQKIDDAKIEEFLTAFIGEKLLEKEIEDFGIILSDNALSKLIKNQKDFQRDNIFSRTEYEKFLLQNNITAGFFELNLSKHEKKKQLLDFIGGGVLPSTFLVNSIYDKINQKRHIELINLKDFFEKNINFSDDEIENYYKNNKDNFIEVYKTVKILELDPKILINSNEYNDLFYEKIDEIDDLVSEGNNINNLLEEFNIKKIDTFIINSFGEDKTTKKQTSIPKNIIKNIFLIDDKESATFIENEGKYFVYEITKNENIQKKLENQIVRKEILENLKIKTKTKLISEIIAKINNNNFNKSDFDKMSVDKNLPIQRIVINSQTDDKTLGLQLISQIYLYPEKKAILVNDLGFKENFLVYIDKIENVNIDKQPKEYDKYLNLSKIKITNDLLNTYDRYIKNKYKIDINYNSLKIVKNYFN